MKGKRHSLFEIKKTILVVDDEPINREILSAILSNDFNVLKAEDGKEAIDILLKEEQKIDLVLLDVFMPYDGREVLKDRQQNRKLKKIPFIVCTSDKNIEEECFHLGVNDFVKKPYENPDIIVARIKRMIELYEDRSILKEVEREKLTNFYNREFFKKYSQQFDSLYPDLKKDMIAISVNRFRLINELYGRAFGDKVLLAITETLNKCLENCRGIVGKDGGSTFIIYAEHHDSYEELFNKLASSINNVVGDIGISIRLGVYPFVDQSMDKEIVIERTESTADSLSNDYTKNIAIYNEEKQAKTLHIEELIDSFQQALEEEQFKLFFQPKYKIKGDKPEFVSAEVLIRWISPKFGFVNPGEFINLFEENGLIGQLDSYILEKAAKYMGEWKKKYGLLIPLSVNLSRVDIYRPTLVEDIIRFVDSNDIPHSAYNLEITESAYVEDAKEVISVVNKIRNSGFKVEIDDFGSGYSSFNTLIDLPFDVLKIDMQIIKSMDRSEKVKEIIKMIINLSKTMEAVTVAEGVETADHYAFLKENGCDVVQGYYLSRPLSLADFEKLIEKDLM
ncbi:MAG: EAL domain-containing protein [Bacilli bacterium]|nr:EAL domain-containing protein [Bacilli bacterium]